MAQMTESHVLFSDNIDAPLSSEVRGVVQPIANAENTSKAPYAHYYRQYADFYGGVQYMYMDSRNTYENNYNNRRRSK